MSHFLRLMQSQQFPLSRNDTDNMQNVSVRSQGALLTTYIVCLTIKLKLDMYLDEKCILETPLKSSWLLETPWQHKQAVN